MNEEPVVYRFYFSVWIENKGFYTYSIQMISMNISVMKAFRRTVDASTQRDVPIPTTYRGREARWEFAYGADGQDVEYIDPNKTFLELGIQPEATITVGPIDVLGSTSMVERIRFDRRQLIEFIDLNANLLETVKIGPRSFHLRLKGINGITELDSQGAAVIGLEHEFEIVLGDDYPLRPPGLRPKSKIFHPNVAMTERKICAWVDWRADMEQVLPWICFQVCDLVQYRKVNLEEPHRRMNLAASEWFIQEQATNPGHFPLSNKTFRGFRRYCRYCSRTLPEGSNSCAHCGRSQ